MSARPLNEEALIRNALCELSGIAYEVNGFLESPDISKSSLIVSGAILLLKQSIDSAAKELRAGLSEVAQAVEAAGDDAALVLETAMGNLDEKLAGLGQVLDIGNAALVESQRGIEAALLKPRPRGAGPCRRAT